MIHTDEQTPDGSRTQTLKKDFRVHGQNLVGELILPEGEGPFPAVVFAHELCSTHESGMAYGRFLSQYGIAFYAFDFRGGSLDSKSDGKTTDMSVMTEADDIEAVLRALRDLHEIDEKHIVLMGASQGGTAAVAASSRYPDLQEALILISPALFLTEMAHHYYESLDEVENEFDFLGWLWVGKRYIADIWNYDVYEDMKRFPKPVLIIHGDNDQLISYRHSKQALKSYPNAELYPIREAGHIFKADEQEEALELILDFLRKIGWTVTRAR